MAALTPQPGILIAALMLSGAIQGCERAPGPPPRLGRLSGATFRDQTGATVSLGSLRGRPMVANFIFTRCPDRCPLFTARFSNLQRSLARTQVQYVSFSVDPTFDSPSVLADYAARYEADPTRWRFLTGSLKELRQDVLAAFLVHLEGRSIQGEPDLMEIVHGELFILVDGQGHVRGFFGSSPAEQARLSAQLEQLAPAKHLQDPQES